MSILSKPRISGFSRPLVLLSLMVAWPLHAAADQIYHWVDEQGVNHYSQSPPPAVQDDVRTLEVDGSQPASYNPEEDRYHVAAQAEAMQALRDEMAEDRKERLKAAERSASNTVVYYPQEQAGNAILYPPGGYRPRPPGRPPGHGHRPKPPEGGRPDRPTPLPEEITPPASKPFRPL